MAKYDFQNCRYSLLWDSSEGRQILDAILNDPVMIRSNFGFWKEKFQVDPMETPTNGEGAAVFVSRMRRLNAPTMLHMRAPLGDSVPVDKAGVESYTGVIVDFISNKFYETAPERKYKEDMFINNFGNDAFLVRQYINEVQSLIDGADQTLSNMSAQLLSTGQIVYNFGLGAQGAVYKAAVPAENFVTAGEKVWSAADCMLLDQMAKIEEDMRTAWGAENIALVWEIPYNMFHQVFLKNKQVMDFVKSYRYFNNLPITENMVITEDMFRSAIGQFEGLSPIYVIEEKQKDYTGMVHGWKDNAAVLRPAGYAGMIRHTGILDQKMYEGGYGSNLISRVYSKTGNGLYTIENSVHNNGNFKEWHTSLMVSAVPSLDEFLYHVIVDTAAAS